MSDICGFSGNFFSFVIFSKISIPAIEWSNVSTSILFDAKKLYLYYDLHPTPIPFLHSLFSYGLNKVRQIAGYLKERDILSQISFIAISVLI